MLYPFDKTTGKGGSWYNISNQQETLILPPIWTFSRIAMPVAPRSTLSGSGTHRQRVLANKRPRTQGYFLKGYPFTSVYRQKRVKPTIRRVPEYDPNQNCGITRPSSRLKLVATENRISRVATKIENRPSLFGPSLINPFVLTGYPNRIYNSPISDKNLRKIQTQAYRTSTIFQDYTKYISQYNKNKTNKIDASQDQFQIILKVREFVNQLLEDIDNNNIDLQKIIVEGSNLLTNAFALKLEKRKGFLRCLMYFWKQNKIEKLRPLLGATTTYGFGNRIKNFGKTNHILKAELDEEIEKMELIQKEEGFNDNLYKSLKNLRDFCDLAEHAVLDHFFITLQRALFEPSLHKYIVDVKTHDFLRLSYFSSMKIRLEQAIR